MAAAIARRCGHPLAEVASAYNGCHNWSDCCKKYNLSMSDIACVPMAPDQDSESFNVKFVSQYYGVTPAEITALRNQGCSWSDVNMCANICTKASQPIQAVYKLRSQGMTWQQCAAQYNVSASDACTPCPAKCAAPCSSTRIAVHFVSARLRALLFPAAARP